MIGRRLRTGLRVVAYLLLAGGLVSAVATLLGHLTGTSRYDDPVSLLAVVLVSMASPLFQGGVLLILLSIDERLEARP